MARVCAMAISLAVPVAIIMRAGPSGRAGVMPRIFRRAMAVAGLFRWPARRRSKEDAGTDPRGSAISASRIGSSFFIESPQNGRMMSSTCWP